MKLEDLAEIINEMHENPDDIWDKKLVMHALQAAAMHGYEAAQANKLAQPSVSTS